MIYALIPKLYTKHIIAVEIIEIKEKRFTDLSKFNWMNVGIERLIFLFLFIIILIIHNIVYAMTRAIIPDNTETVNKGVNKSHPELSNKWIDELHIRKIQIPIGNLRNK